MVKRVRLLGSTLKLLEFTRVKSGLPFDGSMIDPGPPPAYVAVSLRPPVTLMCQSFASYFIFPKSGCAEGPFALYSIHHFLGYMMWATLFTNEETHTRRNIGDNTVGTHSFPTHSHRPMWHVEVHSTLCSITPVATKVHVILQSFVVLTRMRDIIELV
jgi:hypothetical protein